MALSSKIRSFFISLVLALICFGEAYSQHVYPGDSNKFPGYQAMGRWDITISTPKGHVASWLQITKSGTKTLVGQFVGRGGSARPISEINFSPKTKTYSFTIPPQYGSNKTHMKFELNGDKLTGWESHPPKGGESRFTAVRAPELRRSSPPKWGTSVHLLKNSLSAWKVPKGKLWKIENGVLIHTGRGGNLITMQKFNDFKLHIEFRVGRGANSGIYLRGRYEVQVLDSYGLHTESHELGGIYGFITPTVNAAKKPNQWQTFDIKLIGRMVSVVLNGTKIICNRPIPGITGGAINSHEGQPGPIMLQGSENGRIVYRNIILTPVK